MNHLEMALSRIGQIERQIGVRRPETPPSDASGADFSRALNARLQTLPPAAGQAASAGPDEINALIQQASQREGLDPSLVKAVVQAESGMNPRAVSSVGAQGLMQLMPATAREMGVSDPFDPAQNIAGGTRYLKGLVEKYQSAPLAVAAYNAGPGAVDRHHGVPPYAETRGYVSRVMSLQRQYAQNEVALHD
ncbi:MAG: lytic transglycosylase domain-containing protein [Vampirovibrionales bacterium]|nr:lytic transglycosylase domain-containing protein [Vampirovibrionales bacterium]